MASTHLYRWNPARDTVWHVAGQYMAQAGYLDVPSFVDQIRAANPAVQDWQNVPSGTLIVLPFANG